MKFKKDIICIIFCCLFVFLSCEKNQPEKSRESQIVLQQEAVDKAYEEAQALAEKEAAEKEAAEREAAAKVAAEKKAAEKAEAERKAAEKAAEKEKSIAVIRQKYGNIIKTALIEELVNNFDFSLSLIYLDVTIYNEKGNWNFGFEETVESPFLISHDVFDDSLRVYVSLKGRDGADPFLMYKVTVPRRKVIDSIYNEHFTCFDVEIYDRDCDNQFLGEIPSVKNEDKYFITDSKIDNSDSNKYNRNDDIENLFANTVWITSNIGNQKYREVNSDIVKLADGCKYLIFEKQDDDIIVFYGYSDFPGESPVYDHFAGRISGVDNFEGGYTFYINPITNIDKIINDCFVDDISGAVYGTDLFAITFKQGDVEGDDNLNLTYVAFDENFGTDEGKFVKYENSNLLGEFNASVLRNDVPVYSSEFVGDPKIAVLNEGDIIRVLYKGRLSGSDFKDEDSWYFCQIRDGSCGWIFGEFIDSHDRENIPVKDYTVHETNLKENMPINYGRFFNKMFMVYEEDRLGYVPLKDRKGEFIIKDNKFLSNEFGGKIYIGMDRSELIKVLGEPIREINEFTLEYCQEYLAYDCFYTCWYYGTFYFTPDNKLKSIKIVCDI